MTYELKNKVILITGGASGIGLSCVQELLNFGVKGVTIADVNATKGEKIVQELIQQYGANRVVFAKIDVNKTGQLEAAFKITLDFWKSIDVVINNAGIMNDNQWEREIAVNCKSVVQGTLLGLEYMGLDRGGKGGIIVNVASLLGLQPFACLPIYTGTKHFVVGFSRSIGDSYHYNRTGVKVLTFCPGVTNTELLSSLERRSLNLSPDMGRHLAEEANAAPIQPAKNVGLAMVKLLTMGENGGVWLAEGNKPLYKIEMPHWSTFEIS